MQVNSQVNQSNTSMSNLRIGDTAPDFTAQTQQGELSLHQFLGDGWGVLFSHPADFTPVCTTELGTVARLEDEFAKRRTKTIALSVDDADSHKRWIGDINETQHVQLAFPIVADSDRKVAEMYDMIHPNANEKFTVRSVFFIDPQKKIRAIITYPPAIGRNFHEILRVIDALQTTDQYKVAAPANWEQGDEVIVAPQITNEEADKLFPQGYREEKPYLRYTKLQEN